MWSVNKGSSSCGCRSLTESVTAIAERISAHIRCLICVDASSILSAMSSDWRDRCAARRQQQRDEIPKEWLIELPPADQHNVIDIPRQCGLLSERELLITETVDVELMLRRLASAEWSSEEVTTAFYKRAIIAHQLVLSLTSLPLSCRSSALATRSSDKLPDGDLCRARYRSCPRDR